MLVNFWLLLQFIVFTKMNPLNNLFEPVIDLV